MNLNIWQTMFLALLQGVTELFPISSLGHTVILPGLFGWGDLVRNDSFLPLIVALHLGTSVALVLYFWRDWLQVVRTLVRSVKEGEVRTGTQEWVSWLIIIGCIPAGLLGVFLEKPLKLLFASPLIAAAFLVVNGSLLFAGERLRRRAEAKHVQLPPNVREAQFRRLSSLTWKEALIRYSFLLGTPLIGAAALLEVPQLLGQSASTLLLVGLGMVLAGVAAYLSTRFLMRYFETGRLDPFAYYCWAAGIGALILLLAVLHTGG